MKLPSSSTYGFWLAIVRIFTGAVWLNHAIAKFEPGFMPPDGLIVGFLGHGAQIAVGPYHQFMVSVVLPNITLFANLVRVGELVTGILLIFGFQTRLGALIGMVLTVNYLSAQGILFTAHGWTGIDGTVFALSFISLILPTGRYLGIDSIMWHPKATVAVPVTPVVAATTVPSSPTAAPDAVHAEFVDEAPTGAPNEVRRL